MCFRYLWVVWGCPFCFGKTLTSSALFQLGTNPRKKTLSTPKRQEINRDLPESYLDGFGWIFHDVPDVHPGKINMEDNHGGWKIIFLSKWVICRFDVFCKFKKFNVDLVKVLSLSGGSAGGGGVVYTGPSQ